MSKEEFQILRALLEKLITVLSPNNPYESIAYWLPLISALIGATAVLIPQFIMWFVKLRKERVEKSRELLAEAYRNSFLLIEYYKDFVMHKVHKQYWYKAHTKETDSKYKELYYQRHHESNEDSFETNLRIKPLIADYVKIVKNFQILNNNNGEINSVLEEMSLFKPRKASNFDSVADDNLYAESVKEEESLNKEYGKYKEFFDKINSEMEKSLR